MNVTEREVEAPWVIAEAIAPVLDVGCAESTYLADLPQLVDGIDWRPVESEYLREFFRGDIRTAPVVIERRYATVAAVSTIEHVGLAHASYGTKADDSDGDRHALEACYELCRPGGRVLMSVPYGRAEHRGWYRMYDFATLAELCEGLDWSHSVHVDSAWDVGGVALVTIRRPG